MMTDNDMRDLPVGEDAIQPDIAIPPGEFLAEVLEDLGMTQTELAHRLGRPVQAINEIIKGTKAITAETALQLEQVLDTPAHIWLNLERDYRLTLARIAAKDQLQQELELLPQFPYNELAKLGWVPQAREAIDKVRALLRFFAIASFSNLPDVQTAAFRRSDKMEASPYALAAWLRCGQLRAASVETADFSVTALRAALPAIRALTREAPQSFLPKLSAILAECGIALVLVPHLPKTYAHGATFWLGSKAVVQMSIRGKYSDIFWFSLMHELGHLVLHGKKVFIETDAETDPTELEKEAEADRFAANTLIPKLPYQAFIRQKPVSGQGVARFAEDIGVTAAIVVGRLHHDGVIPRSHLNHLREKYEWTRPEA